MQNKEQCAKKTEDFKFQRIKKSSKGSGAVHCIVCKRSYTKEYFYRHKQKCSEAVNAKKTFPKPMPPTLLVADEEPDFVQLLSSFQNNEIGNLCRIDKFIRIVGKHSWQKDKTKVDKHDEV